MPNDSRIKDVQKGKRIPIDLEAGSAPTIIPMPFFAASQLNQSLIAFEEARTHHPPTCTTSEFRASRFTCLVHSKRTPTQSGKARDITTPIGVRTD